MEALVTVDGRKIVAVARALKIPNTELARRANARPEDVSRMLNGLSEGGLLDRLAVAVTDIAAEQAAATQ